MHIANFAFISMAKSEQSAGFSPDTKRSLRGRLTAPALIWSEQKNEPELMPRQPFFVRECASSPRAPCGLVYKKCSALQLSICQKFDPAVAPWRQQRVSCLNNCSIYERAVQKHERAVIIVRLNAINSAGRYYIRMNTGAIINPWQCDWCRAIHPTYRISREILHARAGDGLTLQVMARNIFSRPFVLQVLGWTKKTGGEMIDIIGKITRRVRLWALRVDEQTSCERWFSCEKEVFCALGPKKNVFCFFASKAFHCHGKHLSVTEMFPLGSRQFIEFHKLDISFRHFTKPLCREKPHLFLKAAIRLIQHAIWKTKVLIVAKMALWLMLKGFGQNFLMHQRLCSTILLRKFASSGVTSSAAHWTHRAAQKLQQRRFWFILHTHTRTRFQPLVVCELLYGSCMCVCRTAEAVNLLKALRYEIKINKFYYLKV